MKRSVFIIIGVALVLILIAVWLYVLFFSPSVSNDEGKFADLDIENSDDPNFQEPVVEPETEPVVDVQANQPLRQLTTRPVAGFAEIQASTSTPKQVRYMEVGTGHIYSINLLSGQVERISATTITGAQKAAFSKDGMFVMIQAGFSSQKEFIVGEINPETNTLTNTKLAEPITSFSGTDDNQFLYSIQTNASTIGKLFNPTEFTNETIFTVPFREASIEWGSDVTDPHYVYPKTSRLLESFLYQIENGVATRMPVDGYGMSALGNKSSVVYSKQENNVYQTYQFNIDSGIVSEVPLTQIPEKCAMSDGELSVTICANTEYESTALLPDNWYAGEVPAADKLWEIGSAGDRATFLIDSEQASGRGLDITELQISEDMFNVYFTNQIDQTLWVYERIVNDVNQN